MNNLLTLPVMLPLGFSLLALLWPRRASSIGILALLATLLASAWLTWRIAGSGPMLLALGGWEPGLGIALYADALSSTLLLMSSIVALAAGVYSTGYFREPGERARFWPLWLLLLTALHALFLSGDLFNLYVTLELLGLSAVALAALGGKRKAVEAALRYLILGLLGSLLFLAGVALIYAGYGTLDLMKLREMLAPEPVAWVALTLMISGLLLKSALFPLHFWLPPAHANAPAPVSAVLSALVVKAALYLLLRFWLDIFDDVVTTFAAWLLGTLGAMAVLWGSWKALRAVRLKLLAAYSTVAQLGYLFLFFPLLDALPAGAAHDTALGALILMALTHGFAKSALFLATGVIQQRAGHDRIEELGGAARALPATVFTLALAGVALIGLPPSGSFLAKWQLFSAAIATGQWLWIPVIATGSLLAAAYVFRILGYAFAPAESVKYRIADGREELPALILAILATLLLGFGSIWVWEFVTPGALAAGEAA
ncbi:MAG: proton-conducting transporter membrane subunit [Chromatiales bacterium]